MALYIKDPEVDTLVERYLALSGAKNKTDAVRKALESCLKALEARETLAERVAKVQQNAAKAGLRPRDFDDKKFMDEQWGDV